MDNSSSEASVADSKEAMSVQSSDEIKPGDDWNSDDSTEKTPSAADHEKPVTSPNGQQVAEVETEAAFNLGFQVGQPSPDTLTQYTRERRSPPPMANSGRNSSIRSSSPPSVSSFAELPSTSYLAAALKLSAASSTSAEGFGDSSAPLRDRSFSPPEETSARGQNSKEAHSSFQSNPFFNVSFGEAVAISAANLTSSLLKNSGSDSSHLHLSNMMQGFPLLSSVLPALQRLTPTSLTSLSTGGGGIVCVCGVKFNSTSNLEAHRMFYCSQRQVSSDGRSDRKEENQSPSRDNEGEASSPPGHILKCPHCSYTTTHKLSLNGHMNIHTNPEEAPHQSSFSQALADPKAQERYCSDCDIQFSSMKTYRVHKLHYCQTRHVLKGSKSPVRDESIQHIPGLNSIGSTHGNAQLILALPTNPILLLPYSLVAGAQILPPHILPHIGAAFVLPNGQVHPIPAANAHPHTTNGNASLPPLLSPNAMAAATAAVLASSSSSASQSNISLPLKSESFSRSRSPPKEECSGKRRGEGDSPLDLTVKRPKLTIKTDLLSDEEKENREINVTVSPKSLNSKITSFSGGEFEGRLLSSPPNESSSTNGEPATINTICPKSVTPSLSPRILPPESPKPSTSTLSNSSRSPSHSSPVNSSATPSLPPLPPGFPASLIKSLESLGSSLPLASLHCLQSLQNVPRELALKLLNPDLLMKSLPSALNPPVIVKQGEAKCNECNIVFYKEESLQIHKKHYCSARDTKKSIEEEVNSNDQSPTNLADAISGTSPVRSPVGETVPSAQTYLKESPKQSKTLLQFICTACGIKFSSPDNLTAHQTYYCPKREGAGEDGSAKGVWRCPRCRVVMAETMQAAHRCVSPSPTPSHGWKCPCCPVLSPTAAAAQKHLETHSGIKAFRCTICGYRGNTLRGMRTHIRMHFEKRTNDLQEENFIACILDDEEPKSCRASASSDTRKLLESTRLLLEKNVLSSLFGGENKLSDHVESSYNCVYCPFITTMQSTLLQHLTLVHNVGLETKISQDIKNFLEAKVAAAEEMETKNEDEIGARENSPPIQSVKLEPEVKLEVNDSDEETIYPVEASDAQSSTVSVSAATATLSNSSSPSTSGKCYCHTCKISFSLTDSYTAHKKFYCSRPQSSTPPETTVQ